MNQLKEQQNIKKIEQEVTKSLAKAMSTSTMRQSKQYQSLALDRSF